MADIEQRMERATFLRGRVGAPAVVPEPDSVAVDGTTGGEDLDSVPSVDSTPAGGEDLDSVPSIDSTLGR